MSTRGIVVLLSLSVGAGVLYDVAQDSRMPPEAADTLAWVLVAVAVWVAIRVVRSGRRRRRR